MQISLEKFDIHIEHTEYYASTGLRTKEFLEFWLGKFNIDLKYLPETEADITSRVISKVFEKGTTMKGVELAIESVKKTNLKIGLASSSPLSLIHAVLEKTGLQNEFTVVCSAEHLPFGKPHPQVFINCALALNSHPVECLCFEDSFNGLIAAKAARMKCVVVPHPDQFNETKWNLADLKLASLDSMSNETLLNLL